MKKIVLSIFVLITCFTAKAQEPEKKKETKTGTKAQERAINESGVSVKTEPKKGTKSKAVVTPTNSPEQAKPIENKKEATKPE